MLTHKSFLKKAENIFNTSLSTKYVFLYYLDFVEFKLINSYYGIDEGNSVIMAVETYLSQIPEIVAYEHLFSDQFVFIVTTNKQMSNKEIVESYASYAETFLSKQRIKYPDCNLRTCCGIYAVKNNNVLEALDNANIAWLQAKKRQLSNVILFDPSMLEELSVHQKAEQEISLALKENRFMFYLQPKVNLLSGEIIGLEALARFITPEGKTILPESFLSIMEENGSIVELDLMLLRKICAYTADRISKKLPVIRTSVNISRLHIQIDDTVQRFHSIVQEYGIPPELLDFELTETILINEFNNAKILCRQLHEHGYSVSIDDFGAGYAGINILQELDFDTLKLDRKFLSDEEPLRSRNQVILPSIVNILKELKVDVICEGVETAEQCQYLAKIGCTQAQGYYFSRPLPPEQVYETYMKLDKHYPISF